VTGCGKQKNIFAKQNLNKRTLVSFFRIRTMHSNPMVILFAHERRVKSFCRSCLLKAEMDV
jgi:hypothetical protein